MQMIFENLNFLDAIARDDNVINIDRHYEQIILWVSSEEGVVIF